MSFSFPQQFDNRHETHAGFSAMHLAAFRNHAEMVKMLLMSRANPDAQVSVCLSALKAIQKCSQNNAGC